jgi:hypothetical protein
MDVTELAAPQGTAFKFASINDKVQGTVIYVGDWHTHVNNFGTEETSLKIVLEVADGEPVAIYPKKGSPMVQAIAEAIQKAGQTKLLTGSTLGVKYSGDKDTGKGNPLKLFTAVYEAPPRKTPSDRWTRLPATAARCRRSAPSDLSPAASTVCGRPGGRSRRASAPGRNRSTPPGYCSATGAKRSGRMAGRRRADSMSGTSSASTGHPSRRTPRRRCATGGCDGCCWR